MFNIDPDEFEENEDVERVRNALKDYYGTAMTNGFPIAVADLSRVDGMDDEEVISTARNNGII